MADQEDTKKQKATHTYQDDVKSSGGTLDDHGVILSPASKKEHSGSHAKTKYHKPSSILTNKDDVFDVTGAFKDEHHGGTIITDKRGKKKSFGDTFTSALTEWAHLTKKNVGNTTLRKERISPKIATAKTRSATITKASEKSHQAPRDDHKIVIQRIRTMDRDAQQITGKPYLIKDAPTDQAAWSHTTVNKTDTPTHTPIKKANITPMDKASLVAPSVSEHSQVLPPRPQKLEPEKKEEPQILVRKEDLVEKKSTPAATDIPQKHTAHSTGPHIKKSEKKKSFWSFLFRKIGRQRSAEDIAIMSTPEKKGLSEKDQALAQEQKPPIFEKSIAPETKQFHDKEQEHDEQKNVLVPPRKKPVRTGHKFMFTSVIVFGIVAGLGLSYFVFNLSVPNLKIPLSETTVRSFLPVTTQISIPFSTDRAVLLRSIQNAINNAPVGVTHIYPTQSETTTVGGSTLETPVNTASIFQVIDARAPSPFIRSLLPDVMFGAITVSQNEPFVILKSNVFDVAFAGMIDWEPFIISDLAPLFGQNVVSSYDENSRTLEGTFKAHFVDTIIVNRNVRILRDETGKDRLIYQFINKETILITTTPAAFEKLLDVLR